MECPLFLLQQGLIVCDDVMTGARAAGNTVPLAATACPFPDNCGMHLFLSLPPSPSRPALQFGCWWPGWRGGETTPKVGAVAVNVDDTCFPDPWCCSLSPALFLVCIYVAPVMHIYTGIKYIALYNIIYVCGIRGITSNEGYR